VQHSILLNQMKFHHFNILRAFKDLVLYADSRCPDQTLEGALEICFRLSSTKFNSTDKNNNKDDDDDDDSEDEEEDNAGDGDAEHEGIAACGVIQFMTDIGQAPPSTSEVNLLLVSMQPYDDCSREPCVSQEAFVGKMVSLAVMHSS